MDYLYMLCMYRGRVYTSRSRKSIPRPVMDYNRSSFSPGPRSGIPEPRVRLFQLRQFNVSLGPEADYLIISHPFMRANISTGRLNSPYETDAWCAIPL